MLCHRTVHTLRHHQLMVVQQPEDDLSQVETRRARKPFIVTVTMCTCNNTI